MFPLTLLLKLALIVHILLDDVIESHFCTPTLCKLCCRPVQIGCINRFTRVGSGILLTNNISCQDCNCSNPDIGCGWIGEKFNRVECTSCEYINNNIDIENKTSISGCGKNIISGALVYID